MNWTFCAAIQVMEGLNNYDLIIGQNTMHQIIVDASVYQSEPLGCRNHSAHSTLQLPHWWTNLEVLCWACGTIKGRGPTIPSITENVILSNPSWKPNNKTWAKFMEDFILCWHGFQQKNSYRIHFLFKLLLMVENMIIHSTNNMMPNKSKKLERT